MQHGSDNALLLRCFFKLALAKEKHCSRQCHGFFTGGEKCLRDQSKSASLRAHYNFKYRGAKHRAVILLIHSRPFLYE